MACQTESLESSRTDECTVSARSGNGSGEELLSIACHELRSPLASIRYALGLLSRQTQEAPERLQLQTLLERQAGRMTRLIEDLLDVSRMGGGRLQLHCERIDLRDIVKRAIETLAPDIEARAHRLTTAAPETPVWLMGDPFRLEQVFVNLLANAAKYTEAGGRLAIWIHARDTQAIVRIRDSGIGIPPHLLPRIFDLFTQADQDDPRSRSGLGLGLAIVRSLVELHGGRVTAASRGSGHGSEFAVCLPVD